MYRLHFSCLILLIIISISIPISKLDAQEIILEELSQSLIGGNFAAVAFQDDYAFIATGYGFKILDVHDFANPFLIVEIPTNDLSSGINVEDDYLFVCDSDGGLIIYDISEIENPVITDQLNPPGYARSVCPYGDYLYIGAEDYGMQIVDYSDPYNLELVDIIYTGGEAIKVLIYEQWLYVTLGVAGLGVYDIINPVAPNYIMTWNTTGGNAKGMYLFPNGDFLAMADFQNGVHLLDLAFPWIPAWSTTITLQDYSAGDVSGGADYGVCSYWNQGIQTFDLSGNELDFFEVGGGCGAVGVHNDFAFVCQGDSGLKIVSCESPGNMFQVAELESMGNPTHVIVQNNVAYVSTRSGGLAVMDVSDPTNPIHIESIETGFWTMEALVSPDNYYLYVTDFYTGLNVFSLADPLHPQWLNAVATEPDTGAHSIYYRDGHLYLTIFDQGINVFDISNPVNPELVYTSPEVVNYVRTAAFSEDGLHFYVCAQDDGVLIYTIHSPDSLVYEYSLDFFDRAYDIVINGDFVFVADFDIGLYVLDISNFAYVFKVDSLPVQVAASGVTVIDDDYLAFCDWTAGLAVVDISDPTDISEVDRIETPGFTLSSFSDGNYVYLADSYDFSIFSLYGTGVDNNWRNIAVPQEEAILYPPYPNPFNSSAALSFDIARNGNVKLILYNINGEEVKTLFDSYCEAGNHIVNFNAGNLASGVYFASLETGIMKQTQKLLLMR